MESRKELEEFAEVIARDDLRDERKEKRDSQPSAFSGLKAAAPPIQEQQQRQR
ncbi:MAG: hypothetical protein RB191_08835 [Terriglobia bacterium]|nr:hypothetical protein [Terriglobia bacterium]